MGWGNSGKDQATGVLEMNTFCDIKWQTLDSMETSCMTNFEDFQWEEIR